ncbi:MAG: GldG family protein [Deltaproteobacteria bacterium]|nr:GldG family protein [Deltaproteobacteria bacterium]
MMARPRRFSGDVNALVGILLLAVVLVLANYVSARHYRRFDWTRARVYALSDRTIQVLRGLRSELRVTVVEIPDAAVTAGDVYGAVREVLDRFQSQSRMVKVEYLDPIRDPERAKILLAKYRITNFDVQTGVVVFDNGTQNKYVTQDEIVEYEVGQGGRGRKMKAFKGEAAFLAALMTISEKPRTICFVKGHLEGDIESFERTGYSTLSDELRRDAFKTKGVEDLARAGVPADCDALVVGGPQRAWLRPEVDALEAWLARGGRAVLLLGPVFDWGAKAFKRTGLEDLVERRGVKLGQNIVIDPKRMAPMGRLIWKSDRYADHPITARMTGAPTSWPLAREVRAPGAPGLIAKELVSTTEQGWGESNLGSFDSDEEPRFDAATDAKGPVPVAAAVEDRAGGARLVVFGSSAFVSNAILDLESDFNRDLLVNSVSWAVGREQAIGGVAPKATEHIKLSITGSQLWTIGLIAVLLMPLGAALLGASVWWLRRS